MNTGIQHNTPGPVFLALMKLLLLSVVSFCILCVSVPVVMGGGFYLIPSAGVAISTEGNRDVSIGAGAVAGYEFTSYLAAGVEYRYLHATGNQEMNSAHLYGVDATLFKKLAVVTPYVRVGVGAYTMTFDHRGNQTDPMVNVGAGLHIQPIPFLGLTLGITYYVLTGTVDLFEPEISFLFSLGK